MSKYRPNMEPIRQGRNYGNQYYFVDTLHAHVSFLTYEEMRIVLKTTHSSNFKLFNFVLFIKANDIIAFGP